MAAILNRHIKRAVRKIVGNYGISIAQRAIGWSHLMLRERKFPRKIVPQCEHISGLSFRDYSINGKHVFFGYYDRPQFDRDEKLILAGVCALNSVSSKSDLEVGYFSVEEPDQFHKLASTNSWSWQQGCMLQWLPGQNGHLIFNELSGHSYASSIFDVGSKRRVGTLRRPIYSVSPCGRYGLSCNYSRLARLRPGYGYSNLPDNSLGDPAPRYDGVWALDIARDTADLILSSEDIAGIHPHETMRGAEHYIHHFQFNSSGDRFLFIHLWVRGDNQYSRLFTCNTDGSELRLLSDHYVSHYSWISRNDLIAYSFQPSSKLCYHIYTDKTDDVLPIYLSEVREDGHCSSTGYENLFISDTYPNAAGYQRLFIFSKSGLVFPIATIYSSIRYQNELRCDLHPRMSLSGSRVCVDTTYRGKRSMLVFSLSNQFWKHVKSS